MSAPIINNYTRGRENRQKGLMPLTKLLLVSKSNPKQKKKKPSDHSRFPVGNSF